MRSKNCSFESNLQRLVRVAGSQISPELFLLLGCSAKVVAAA